MSQEKTGLKNRILLDLEKYRNFLSTMGMNFGSSGDPDEETGRAVLESRNNKDTLELNDKVKIEKFENDIKSLQNDEDILNACVTFDENNPKENIFCYFFTRTFVDINIGLVTLKDVSQETIRGYIPRILGDKNSSIFHTNSNSKENNQIYEKIQMAHQQNQSLLKFFLQEGTLLTQPQSTQGFLNNLNMLFHNRQIGKPGKNTTNQNLTTTATNSNLPSPGGY